MFLISLAEAPLSLALCFRDPNTTLRAAYKWIRCKEEGVPLMLKSELQCLLFFFCDEHFGLYSLLCAPQQVQCHIWRLVKQLGYYLLQSFWRGTGHAEGEMGYQSISSSGFSRLHRD